MSFLIWYKTIFFDECYQRKDFHAKKSKTIGIKRYEPVWAMVHEKIRKTMGNQDAQYTLEGMINLKKPILFRINEIEAEKGIRGKGSVGKQNVVMAESTPLEDIDSGKKENKFGSSLKQKVLDGHSGEEINETIKESIDNQLFFTDKKHFLCGYFRFCQNFILWKKVQKKLPKKL